MPKKQEKEAEGILGGETALGVPAIPLSEEWLPKMIELVTNGEFNHHEIRTSTSATLLEWCDAQKAFLNTSNDFDEEKNAIPVTPDTVEETVRVLKTGLVYTEEVPEELKTAINQWMSDREDEIDIAEGRDPDVRKEIKAIVPEEEPVEIPLTFEEETKQAEDEAPVPLFLESGGNW